MSVKDLFDLSGTVALVTGGSRGLGLEMAIALGEAGAGIAITAPRAVADSAEETLAGKGIDCLATTCDVTQPRHVEDAVAAVIERFGRSTSREQRGISWGPNRWTRCRSRNGKPSSKPTSRAAS